MSKKPLIHQRWLAMSFATLGSALMYLLRYNLSVAIVAMVEPSTMHHLHVDPLDVALFSDQTILTNFTSNLNHARLIRSLPILNQLDNQTSSNQTIKNVNGSDLVTSKHLPLKPIGFDWDDNVQGIVLSSYFYGYIMLQILGGQLSEKYGAKWVLAAGVAVPSVFTCLTPYLAHLGAWYLVAARVAIGLMHATVLSTGFAIISVWIPEEEKSMAAVLLNVGLELGGMTSLLFTGWACSQPALGWTWAFYLTGLFPLLWLLPYMFLFYSRPEQHPHLSIYENRLISQSKLRKKSMRDRCGTLREVPPKVQWGVILTSRPVLANCAAKFFGYFGYYVITVKMPAFLEEVFSIPISENGLLCALSFAGVMLSKIMCIPLAGYLRNKQLMSLTNLRKCFQTASMFISAISLLAISQYGNSVESVTVFIIFAMFGTGLQCGGETPQLTDFAQDLSGTVFGFCNMFLSLDGILAPLVAGEILEYSEDIRAGWNLVFYLCAILYLIGAILFLWLADSTPQKWAMATFEPKNKTVPTGSFAQLPDAEFPPGGSESPESIRF